VRIADVGGKNSRKRIEARSPAAATIVGVDIEVLRTIIFMGVV
jgi:hypothetical protein